MSVAGPSGPQGATPPAVAVAHAGEGEDAEDGVMEMTEKTSDELLEVCGKPGKLLSHTDAPKNPLIIIFLEVHYKILFY